MKEKTAASFVRGFACALVTLNESFDQPTMCASVIKASGLEQADFKSVSGFDKKGLKKIFINQNQ